jgi:hypothetical protein
MDKIIVSNITIDVIRKDIKNIHLAVYPPWGRVRVAVPLHTNEDAIRLFVISKLGWIKRQQRKFREQQRMPFIEYKERESHYVFGRRYLLNVIERDDVPQVVLKSKKYIELYVRPNAGREKCHEVMTEWYRNQLKTRIPEILSIWEQRLNVTVNNWQVRRMKTKWGSCNTDTNRILINLELAKKPEVCLEYIIVHELIHLIERHHNERFLSLMNRHLPHWKQLRDELNRLPISHAEWHY